MNLARFEALNRKIVQLRRMAQFTIKSRTLKTLRPTSLKYIIINAMMHSYYILNNFFAASLVSE